MGEIIIFFYLKLNKIKCNKMYFYKYNFLKMLSVPFQRNGTLLPERIRVYRGIKNYKDVGRVLAVGNETKMDIWSGNPCNDFRGTDGTIFPPFLDKDKKIWVHSVDICQSMGAYYVKMGKVQGILNKLDLSVRSSL